MTRAPDDARITYIGHATLLIEIGGLRILTDPNFDARLAGVLRRVRAPGVALHALPPLDAILISGAGDIWIGFAIVLGVLVVLAIAAFLFAWRKLSVGAPTPKMAITEAKKIRKTVTSSEGGS